MITLSANAGVGGNRLHSVNSLRSTSNNSSSVVGSQQLASLRLPPLFSSNASSNTFNATHPPASLSSQYQNSGESSGILQAIAAAWEIIIGFLGLAGLFVLGQKTSGLFRGRKA